MEQININELSEVLQSSNINFLLGAGTSTPFLPLLGNIESSLNDAKTDEERETHYKRYLNEVMLPNKEIGSSSYKDANYESTSLCYDNFFLALSEVILQRKSTILSKQVNLFTTNIDILMETSLERSIPRNSAKMS